MTLPGRVNCKIMETKSSENDEMGDQRLRILTITTLRVTNEPQTGNRWSHGSVCIACHSSSRDEPLF